MSPVELLRAAAAALREPWSHAAMSVPSEVAEPLAALFDQIAWACEMDADVIGRVGYGEALRVARVLLGVPNA